MTDAPQEIEFKYRADNIDLEYFDSYCRSKNPLKTIHTSGYDHFYSKAKEPDSFCRHREGPDSNQLTFKRKTTDSNNYIRTEHNIDLAPTVSVKQVRQLCEEFGYKFNASIYKNIFVYIFEHHVLAYYVVYDSNMKELGRFVEIEANESSPWNLMANTAYEYITSIEADLDVPEIRPIRRLKKSLFEMFGE